MKGWIELGIALAFVALLVFAALPVGQELIEVAGRNIPKGDLVADYTLGLAWALVLGGLLLLWPIPRAHKRTLAWLWAAKIVVTLGLMLVYEWSYGLDAYAYFAFGEPARYAALGPASGVEAPRLGAGTGLLYLLSNLHWRYLVADSYHAMKLSFAYVGLLGVYLFARAAMVFFGAHPAGASSIAERDRRLLFFIGLFPSTLQWSSILGKDPVTFTGVAAFCLGVLYGARGRLGLAAFWALSGGVLAAAFRPWLTLILLIPLVVFAVVLVRGVLGKALLGAAAVAAFVVSVTFFSDALGIRSVDDVVERSTVISNAFAQGGSAGESDLKTDNSPAKMLAFAPLGAFSALFRPLPGEVLNLFGVLAGLENLFMLWLVVLALRRGRGLLLKEPVLAWSVALVAVWAVIYGYVSFHNLGTGARFRLQIFPVFSCVALYLALPNRFAGAPSAAPRGER